MSGHSIAGLTKSVVISPCGLPVVPDRSLSHHWPCFEHFIKSAPMVLELGRELNIFPTAVSQTNTFQLAYDSDALMHGDGEFHHRRFLDSSAVTPLPFALFHYNDKYLTFLYVVHFCRILVNFNELQVQDLLDNHCGAAVAGWARRWNHWRGQSALYSRVCKETYSLFVGCHENVD